MEILLETYNKVRTEGAFPIQWREATIISFLKPNKYPKEIAN